MSRTRKQANKRRGCDAPVFLSLEDEMKKIVQISATESTSDDTETSGTLYALCDDGSLYYMIDPWRMGDPKRCWRLLPAITSDTVAKSD